MGMHGGNPLTAEVKIVKPENYESVNQIADLLTGGKIVMLDLAETNNEVARRLIDFLAGVAYATGGHIHRISDQSRTFVVAPSNTAISPAQIKEEQRRTRNNSSAENSIY